MEAHGMTALQMAAHRAWLEALRTEREAQTELREYLHPDRMEQRDGRKGALMLRVDLARKRREETEREFLRAMEDRNE
jgi:hypothetical protein